MKKPAILKERRLKEFIEKMVHSNLLENKFSSGIAKATGLLLSV